MGDWIQMEIKRREKTITSVFLKYVVFYTAGALFWLTVIFMIYYILDVTGEVLPANHMEAQLNESAEEIRAASQVTAELLPEDCAYGVYEYDGTLLYGTFSKEESTQAWEQYQKNNIYARQKGYYRFFLRRNGEICIVKYEISTRFRNGVLKRYLPSPDILLVLSFIVLFLIHTAIVSHYFGIYMRKRLRVLNEVTAKIRNQDLEFEQEHSDLKEVEEVLDSLNRMKEALKASLYRQWNLEKSKEEQIAALAHDIKTPLTVIRGNAELLAEEELAEKEREYDLDILQSVGMIEEYLTILNELLAEENDHVKKGGDYVEKSELSCEELADCFVEQARLLTSAEGYPVVFHRNDLQGKILCNKNQLMRAFHNILGNAMDYSPSDGKIQISLEMSTDKENEYLAVSIVDEGPGFSGQDLKHAKERFYQGDHSRSSRKHYGIGLHTAEKFAAAQGGYLVIENVRAKGAKVTMGIRISNRGLS